MVVNLGFLDRSCYFFIQVVYPHEGEWTPFQFHFCSEYLVAPRTDNLTAICEPIVLEMWDPQHFTNL
jgi:hypothetical protein